MDGQCEIGGYIDLERNSGSQYHEAGIALNCGRNCLSYLIELRKISSIRIPDYLCGAVRQTCERLNLDVQEYEVGHNFCPNYDFRLGSDEYFYLVDYFGQLTEEQVSYARRFSSDKLIIDEAQCFFRKPWDGIDTLYTCRKFFGVPDGAYLFLGKEDAFGRKLQQDESYNRMKHILGRYERSGYEFFQESQDNESFFENAPILEMSPITRNIMRGIDYDIVRAHRESNFDILHSALSTLNGLDVSPPIGPYMYPLFVEHPECFRSGLIEKKIYVPTLWPNVISDCDPNSFAYAYATSIIPIPLDQRYGKEEMERIINVVYEIVNTMRTSLRL